MPFLIDECLSEELVHRARERGHHDATHIRWIGKRGWQDWHLIDVIVEGGYTFVTKNSVDFRGPANDPGSSGEHAKVELHAGLICLNSPDPMNLDVQLDMFDFILDRLAEDTDLYNRCLDITYLPAEDEFDVICYDIPKDGPYRR
jgi:Domain of unknown function (DUF5615)